ncbi:uncharacterized protein [Macrobrachium rosenbergii]|uniref:uncharacterized protein n=1 Tax=Macrobrachium rosenbergii TaxID=79674 RepID=UPI0034D71C3F
MNTSADNITYVILPPPQETTQNTSNNGLKGGCCEVRGYEASALDEYTICAAFSVSFYTGEPMTIYSYALNDTKMLALAITPENFYVTYTKYVEEVYSDELFALDTWRRTCVTKKRGQHHSLYVNGKMIKSWSWNIYYSLPTRGAFVLGEEPSSLLEGLTTGHAFHGQVTDVNVWTRALTVAEIRNATSCDKNRQFSGDWISWETSAWKAYGDVSVHAGGPCAKKENNIFLFNTKLSRLDALKALSIMGLRPYLPVDDEEAGDLKKFLIQYGDRCDNDAVAGKTVWVHARYDTVRDVWKHPDTGENLKFFMKRRKRPNESEKGVVQVSDNTWMTDDVANENCFAGFPEGSGKLFYLRGYHDKRVEICPFCYSFVFSLSTSNQSYYLKGLYRKSIQYKEGRWCLVDDVHKKILGIYEGSTSLPIGRKQWKINVKENRTNTKMLSLSTCSEREFACGDGSCIAMSGRCDKVTDCLDWSDENDCDLVQAPFGYASVIQPSRNLDVQLQVILEIMTVSLRKSTLQLDLVISLRWYDEHMTFCNLRRKDNFILEGEQHKLWKPSIEIAPKMGFSEENVTSLMINREVDGVIKGDDTTYQGSENSLQQVTKMQPLIRCDFNLVQFPFDIQRCSLNITLLDVSGAGLSLTGNKSSVTIRNPQLNRYQVSDYDLKQPGTRSASVLTLTISRKYEEHLWGIYLPTFLLLTIGYGTFFLPADPFSDRGTMALTTLLVLVALYTDYLGSLPGTAFNTQSDNWFIFSLVYLTLIIVAHICVYHPSRKGTAFTSKVVTVSSKVLPVKGQNCLRELRGVGFAEKKLYYCRFLFGAAFICFITAHASVILQARHI